jgi:3-oxoacyl-[acyl-carrier-protein] synthase-3
MESNFKVGILDYHVYLPEKTITAEELAAITNVPVDVLRNKMGIHRRYIGGPDDHPGIMAVKAAKEVLKKTGINPLDIDLILYAGETYAEYTCWTIGIYVQEQIGATVDSCYAFDLSLRCAGTPLGLKVAKETMYADPSLKTVLLVAGNANCNLVNLKDPEHSFMYNMAPAAFAAILIRDYDRNNILGSGIVTDPVFSTNVVGVGGGTRHLTMEKVREIMENPKVLDEINYAQLNDLQQMRENLAQRSLPDFTNAIRKACGNSGIKPEEIDYLSMVATSPKTQFGLMDTLGIARDKTIYLYDYGHCGHPDNFLSLGLGIQAGKVKDGSLVCMLGAGTGYAFSSSIIRWGK